MQHVIEARRTTIPRLDRPGKLENVWQLTLHCGHTAYRTIPSLQRPFPPKRVKCHDCESESRQVYEMRERSVTDNGPVGMEGGE